MLILNWAAFAQDASNPSGLTILYSDARAAADRKAEDERKKLFEGYATAVERIQGDFQKREDLANALKAKAEASRAREEGKVGEETFPGIDALRQSLADALGKIELNRQAELAKLDQAYVGRMTEFRSSLTRSGNLDQAAAIDLKIKEVTAQMPGGNPATDIRRAPASASKDRPFTNTLGMKFVPVPRAKVLFCIHETRWKDFSAYADATSTTQTEWKNQTTGGITILDRADEHPVVNVSWEDAKAFCAWLSEKEKLTYRLPTDHEWSLAAGIGADEDASLSPLAKSGKINGDFPWGTGWPPPRGVGNYSGEERAPVSHIPGYRDDYPTTAPVGSFRPNRLGLFDLSGNVYEWCEDWHNPADPVERVFRGGSWHRQLMVYLRLSTRFSEPPTLRDGTTGFRCVVETEPAKASPAAK